MILKSRDDSISQDLVESNLKSNFKFLKQIFCNHYGYTTLNTLVQTPSCSFVESYVVLAVQVYD